MQSVAEQVASLPEAQRLEALSQLSDAEAEALLFDWRGFLARPDQIAPDGDWDIWTALAGRGWGKTEVGARWVKEQVKDGARSIALVAETNKDLEEVMVKRLLSIYPPEEAPKVRYRPVRITWANGAEALGYNGTEPDQLRGPEFDAAWVDELAKYRYARETWDMLQFCMRAGKHPRQLVTTTPRPIEIIKSIVGGLEGKSVITRGKTEDNASNLAPAFLEKIKKKYEGTRLGRQELSGEILGDLPGALWRQDSIDVYRLSERPQLTRIVVSIDPAITNTEDSDYHGVVVAGLTQEGRGCIIEDGSLKGSPLDWARRAIALYDKHQADGIVVEVNQGGDMVAQTLRSVREGINVIEVRATRGKHVRAEPIAALYEQGRVHHLGAFPDLETQMCGFTSAGYEGDGSPDRADALVWALTELFPEILESASIKPADERPEVDHRGGGAGAWMG